MADDATPALELKGIAASPGIQIGRAVVHNAFVTPAASRRIAPGHVERQIRRLKEALDSASVEIEELQEKLRDSIDETHASIFDTHRLIIRDPDFQDKVITRIRQRLEGPQYAVMAVMNEFAHQFSQVEDAYISSRETDIFDVGKRICKHLSGDFGTKDRSKKLSDDSIIFAHDLSPSDTAQMDHTRLKAIATEIGGPTSHTAILAKALEIPAVVGLGSLIGHIGLNSTVIVDGYEGTVIINPTEDQVRKARNRRRRFLIRERDYRKLANLPAETVDGYRIELAANIEFPSEIHQIKSHGADGVGLFRTEFLYLTELGEPSEDAQFEIYRDVIENVAPGAVIFRTLDVGGDKFEVHADRHRDPNPFLGLRAIRYCLRKPRVFKAQLRAILRASAFGLARIMFPMISSIQEIRMAHRLVDQCKRELADAGEAYDAGIEIGVMIEIPAAALVADEMAEIVDFFSIGTNDLIQYTLAVDRSNERVFEYYDSYHPAVLRLIRRVIDAAHRAGIWVGVCGEMAGDPMTALLFVGMGIDELSMVPHAIPEVKYVLRHIRLSEARRLAGEILNLGTSEEIRKHAGDAYANLRKRRIKVPLVKN